MERLACFKDISVESEALPDDRNTGLVLDEALEIGYEHRVPGIEDINAMVLPMDTDLIFQFPGDFAVPSLLGRLGSRGIVVS